MTPLLTMPFIVYICLQGHGAGFYLCQRHVVVVPPLQPSSPQPACMYIPVIIWLKIIIKRVKVGINEDGYVMRTKWGNLFNHIAKLHNRLLSYLHIHQF